jgi:precorrin-3B C17-methyltransferase
MELMNGKITVIGLGPGSVSQLTPEASDALQAADVVYGYGPYLDRVPCCDINRCAGDRWHEFRSTAPASSAARTPV